MAILHYTLGLPPKKHGGSIQYAYDLMNAQSKTETVFALTCGDTLFRDKIARIKFFSKKNNIKVYRLTNPLTPTLIYGTKNPESQMRSINIDYDNIKNFILSNKIKVLHLHTLMGIHKDIIKYIKELGVKIIYTTHDFYGICPRFNLIDYKGELCQFPEAKKCAKCNFNQPSDKFLRLANSSIYSSLKHLDVLKRIKNIHKSKSNIIAENEITLDENYIKKYDLLGSYFKESFSLIDSFHFNSSQTEKIFKRFYPSINGKVIPVITSGVSDKRIIKYPSDTVHFGFIGSLSEYKGFPHLVGMLSELYQEGLQNFSLEVYSGGTAPATKPEPFISFNPPYKYSEISKVFANLDCIIVPSICYETFSLIVLEGLANGVPVIVSDHVGAQDVVRTYDTEWIYKTDEELKTKLRRILTDPSILVQFNSKIMQKEWKYSYAEHVNQVSDFYNE